MALQSISHGTIYVFRYDLRKTHKQTNNIAYPKLNHSADVVAGWSVWTHCCNKQTCNTHSALARGTRKLDSKFIGIVVPVMMCYACCIIQSIQRTTSLVGYLLASAPRDCRVWITKMSFYPNGTIHTHAQLLHLSDPINSAVCNMITPSLLHLSYSHSPSFFTVDKMGKENLFRE